MKNISDKELLFANANLIRRMASLKVDLLSSIHSFMFNVLIDSKKALDVSRISVWIFKGEGADQYIECVANTDWPLESEPKEPPVLTRKDFPDYFKQIDFGTNIIADNAETHESTKAFLEPYLQPENIKSMLDTIIFSDGFPIGVVCCEQKEEFRHWRGGEIQFAELIADCCTYRLMARKQAELEAKLASLVFIDDLTHLHNRRYFFESIQAIVSLHQREQVPLTIAMLDLDDFKKVNDRWGHGIGDLVLQHFAKLMKETLRSEDIFCRFGGEEFIIAFQKQSADQVVIAIERALTKIKTTPLINNDHSYHFSFSAGVSQVTLELPIGESIKNADKALYKAKQLGKNRVEVA